MKIEEVDELLTTLAEKHGVPKPNYCIYKVTVVKKLDPIPMKNGATMRIKGSDFVFDYRACFSIPFRDGRVGFITLLVRGNRGISRQYLLHEFSHYLEWVKNGYKPLEDYEAWEKRARSFARREMKIHHESKLGTCTRCASEVRYGDGLGYGKTFICNNCIEKMKGFSDRMRFLSAQKKVVDKDA